MSHYVKTDTILDKILASTVAHIAVSEAVTPLDVLKDEATAAAPPLDVVGALTSGPYVALIAEVKRASPSRGVLVDPFLPVDLARTYAANGASMISVLTDEPFFQGHIQYLREIRAAVDVPLLRKDFVVDAYQVYEARAAGADAVLLITAALADAQLADLHALVLSLGMTPLVEVHTAAELDRALAVGPRLIGVNNRDLRTFDVDLNTTGQLAQRTPPGVTLVAESGMKTPDDVTTMGRAGAHAVLIGEGVVTSNDIAAAVHAFSHTERPA